MVNDLLGFSQAQLVKGMPVSLGSADIHQICQSAIEDAHATHPVRKFVLKASGDLHGSFDSIRLHQLFTNLLVNAAQYGAPGSPVTMTVVGESEAVQVQVNNRGSVIPDESLGTIFKPLVQLSLVEEDSARSKTSMGLGLFVAREIAAAHGGEIAVESNTTEGTTFTVRLPRSSNR